MLHLNERLQVIADNISKGQTMADIGTDHGFLPLYLWQNKICPKAILTDISQASLSKARISATELHVGNEISFRVGDGLMEIEEGEVDVIVLAGMGGVLISKILEECPKKTISFSKFILQPRNGCGKLRFWLQHTGFTILSEHLAKEGKFLCEIIVVKPPAQVFPPIDLQADYPGEMAWEIPRRDLVQQEELFRVFVERKWNIEEKVLKRLKEGYPRPTEKIQHTEKRIAFLERLISEGSNKK